MRRPHIVLVATVISLALTGCTGAGTPTESPTPSASTGASATPTPTPTPSSTEMALPDPDDFEAMDPALFAVNTLVDPMWDTWTSVDVSFGTPSRTIGCSILGAEHHELWGCKIEERSWEFPRDSPEDYCFDAQVPCGGGIEANGAELPHPRYRGDPGFPGAFVVGSPDVPIRTLEYGQSVTFGDVTCFSETEAVTCVNNVSGHGFVISRDRNDIF